MKKSTAAVWFSALIAFHLLAAAGAASKNSQTYDEAVHLAAGYSYYRSGSFEMNADDHPPLAKLVAALPLIFIKPDFPAASHPWRADMQGNQYRIGDYFLYKNRVPADVLLAAGRRAMIIFSGVFAAAFFFCVKKLFGGGAALAALFFWVFYPAATANSFLITTDYAAAAFFFLAVFAFYSAMKEGGAGWAAAAGVSTGLALASKFSDILILPSLAACAVIAAARGEKIARPAVKTAVFLAAGGISLAAVYFFANTPLYFEGLEHTLRAAAEKPRATFLAGNYSVGGWRHYFLAAFFLKTPLSMMAAAALFFMPGFPRKKGAVYFAVPAALFLAVASFSKIQIGHRHILPVYPFVAMWAGAGAAALAQKGRWAKIMAAALAAGSIAEFAAAHPWHISYFNPIAGGAGGGYRYLLDSNTDWGQGIGDLAAFLNSRQTNEIYFSYFGSADPEYFGIKYFPIGFVSTVERRGEAIDLAKQPGKYLAVSVTNLYANYYADKSVFEEFRRIKPAHIAAHSIFVYDLAGGKNTAEPGGKTAKESLAELLDRIGERAEAAKVRKL